MDIKILSKPVIPEITAIQSEIDEKNFYNFINLLMKLCMYDFIYLLKIQLKIEKKKKKNEFVFS